MSSEYENRLIKALSPNPSEWEYRGEIYDTESPGGSMCACGHPIRYEFYIYHPDGRKAVVGSTCVENFGAINPEMADRMRNDLDVLFSRKKEEARLREFASNEEAFKKIDKEILKLTEILYYNQYAKYTVSNIYKSMRKAREYQSMKKAVKVAKECLEKLLKTAEKYNINIGGMDEKEHVKAI